MTGILRDFIAENAESCSFLGHVQTAMEKYHHHALHLALGAIAELLRVRPLDGQTCGMIHKIIHAANQHG